MKKYYNLFLPRLALIAVALSFIFIASSGQAQDNNGSISPAEQMLLPEGINLPEGIKLPKEIQDVFQSYSKESLLSPEQLAKLPNPNIKIQIKDKLEYTIKPAENYPITWIIEGLEEGQKVTHTDIHWAYVADLQTPERINDYKTYPNIGREWTGFRYVEYRDDIYIYPSEEKLPSIAVFIHAVIDDKNYVLGPMLVDISNDNL